MNNSDHAGHRLVPFFRRTLCLVLGFAVMTTLSAMPRLSVSTPFPIMPAPAEAQPAEGSLPVTAAFSIAIINRSDARLPAATDRLLRAWETRTGLRFERTAAQASGAMLVVDCSSPGPTLPAVGEDESYALIITPQQATLRASTAIGALRGLATVQQLLAGNAGRYFLPAARIRDQPRFPWRGLMIDVARHWQPIDVIVRNLDGMALVKLNVLHLHLSDDQGFRIESKTHPELQAQGSDGRFFTQHEIRTIIAAAQQRGIRVVPEFDLPGHATSWVVSHPELASQPGSYSIERRWGVFDPVLDPTNEALYALLDNFISEMAALFPDPVFHIGGDENNGVQWNANPRIQEFIREHNLHDNEGLQAYFNRRVAAILARHGKRLMGWDEILHAGLPQDSIIQSWRGPEALAVAARQGYPGVLSHGYYLDLMHPASAHYRNDPLPASTSLASTPQRLILGGEAALWSEWVSPATIDSRIWPRAAAIAERLWSARDLTDVPDMYRRLVFVSARLDEAGMLHEKNYQARLCALAGKSARPSALAAVQTFIGLLEPVREYRRGELQPEMTQSSPLDRLADYARPDSASARAFSIAVDRVLFSAASRAPAAASALTNEFEAWIAAAREIAAALPDSSPALREGAPQVQALAELGPLGLEAIADLQADRTPNATWIAAALATLDRAEQPCSTATELMIVRPLRLLVFAAIEQKGRTTLAADAWRHHVQTAAFPEPAPAAQP